jgi:hypothetical protein
VIVNRDALEAFIAYANSMRDSSDSQFLCSAAEYERSEAEFDALVDALNIPAARSGATGTPREDV